MRTLIAAASRPAQRRSRLRTDPRPPGQPPGSIARLRQGVQALRTGRPARNLLDPATLATVRPRPGLEAARPHPAHRPPAPTSHQPGVAGADPQRDRDARTGVDKLTGPQWEVAIRYAVAHTNPRGGDTDRPDAAAGHPRPRHRVRVRGLDRPQPATPAQTAAPTARCWPLRALRRGFLLNTTELASVAALPHDIAVPGSGPGPGQAHARPGRGPHRRAGHESPRQGRRRRPLRGPAHPRRPPAHLHVLGSHRLRQVHPAAQHDPRRHPRPPRHHRHRPQRRPRHRRPRPHPASSWPSNGSSSSTPTRPPARPSTRCQATTTTWSSTTSCRIFSKIFTKHWGPRIDDVLRVACLTLLRKANATLTLMPPLLNDRTVPAQRSPPTSTTRKGCAGSGSGSNPPRRRYGPRSSDRSCPGCGRSCCATSSAARWARPTVSLRHAPSPRRRHPARPAAERADRRGDRPADGLVRARLRVAGRHRPDPAPRGATAATPASTSTRRTTS